MAEQQRLSRFPEATDREIKVLVDNAIPKNTKKSTKYAINVFDGNKNKERNILIQVTNCECFL